MTKMMGSLTDWVLSMESGGEARDMGGGEDRIAFAGAIARRQTRLDRVLDKLDVFREVIGLPATSHPLLSDGSVGADDDAPADLLSQRVLDGDPDDERAAHDAWWTDWLAKSSSAPSSSDVRPVRITSEITSEIELRANTPARVAVRLSSVALRDLGDEARKSMPRRIEGARDRFDRGVYEDGVESAGYLFGRFTQDALADVDVAIGAGPNSRSTSRQVTFEADDRPARAFENELREVFDSPSTRLIGDWHVHTNGLGEGRPSDADLRSWAQLFERLEDERHASRAVYLIGMSDGGDRNLFRVAWHPWVVSRTPGGQLICEPAALWGVA